MEINQYLENNMNPLIRNAVNNKKQEYPKTEGKYIIIIKWKVIL